MGQRLFLISMLLLFDTVVDKGWGNLFHTCLIHLNPLTADHLPFIDCMESNDKDNVHMAASKCAYAYNVSMDLVNKCMTSRLGNDLEHDMAVRTDRLQPPHKYVPWVTLNGVHTEDIERKAETDLIGLICDAYTV